MNSVWNEEARRRAGMERELTSRVDQKVLRRFGHMESINGQHTARRVFKVKKMERGCGVDRGLIG